MQLSLILPTPSPAMATTGYRLQHLLTGRLSEMAWTSATAAALFSLEHAPRSASDYIVVPVTLPCDCGAEYKAHSICCDRPMRGALVAGRVCPECRESCEVVLKCAACPAELEIPLLPEAAG